jgi:hypothetical protein
MAPASRPVAEASPRPAAQPAPLAYSARPGDRAGYLASSRSCAASRRGPAGRARARCCQLPGGAGWRLAAAARGPGAASTPFASLLAVSSAFHPLFKVLFIFPSRYLFAIGLSPVFSLR